MAKSFVAVLQDTVSPEDSKWEYSIPNLPRSQQTNQAGLIKCLSIVSSTAKQNITLRYKPAPANRVTKNEALDRFVLLSFSDFRLQWPAVISGQPPRPATGKENGDYITRILVTGVEINGIYYHFYGHSNSQLKSRSCFAYAATKEEISAKIEAMGDFSKLKSVGKKSKRIGLLFSSAEVSLTLSPDRCEDIDDVATKDYVFTDGCGLISVSLTRLLAQRKNIAFRDRRYLPSVIQIRYRGYKGVLTLDPNLRGHIQAQFRASMRKFKDSPDLSFAAVDYSKPYTFGSLNDEVVILLHSLGISQETLLSKQAQYLTFLENVQQGDHRAAFQFLSYLGRVELAEKLLLDGLSSVHATLKSLVKQEHAKMINKRDERRCRILIPKSRLLFGVCDPTAKSGFSGRLKEGECFVRITQDGDGRAHTIINTEVLVTRNPCLHPGDLQKFTAVDIPEFAHLVDCIVFSARGQRPSADLMSGGDLDGDKFFVTWDSDIIPRTMSEPALYPGGKEPITFGAVTGDSRAEYFARYTNASLGRIKNLYMKWARLGNAMSPQCQQLNRLFSQCVDGNNIKIPKNLEDPPNPDPTVAPFILDVLHDACTEQISHASNLQPEMHDDPDIMDMLVTRDKMAMSEFELLQATFGWCEQNEADFMAYSHAFDFSALTDEQKIWLLSRLPPTITAPSLVRNALLQSELLTPLECRRFGLDHPQLRWKPVFSSSVDRMARFLPVVCRSLETFHKKLIVLNINERLSIAIYVPQKIARASEVSVDDTVRVFALPRSEGEQSANYRVIPTKVNYRLYCDDHVFQLYQGKRGNTWVFLRSSKGDDASYRTLTSKSARRNIREITLHEKINFDCLASVALDKISKAIQTHAGKVQGEGVLGAEIYVISNRDVASMRVLDQWLYYVDTDEVLPLFEKLEHDYVTPKLSMVDWSKYSESIQNICKDNNLSQLRHLKSVTELDDILSLLRHHNERVPLRDVFSQVVLLASNADFPLGGRNVASRLLHYLQDAPYLTSILLQSQLWKQHKEVIEQELIPLAPIIAKQLVLVFSELSGFARQPLSCLLQEVKQVSLQEFAELVELIALTIRSPEAALNLFLEILEPETSRLLIGRPAAIRQFASSLFGIALDHIDEAASNIKPEKEEIELTINDYKDGHAIVKSEMRIDSSMNGSLKVGDHARLTAANLPENDPCAKPFSMDVLILNAEPGAVTFRCLHDPPSYLADCAWSVTLCGSFVTSKTCFDAVTNFYTQREACCRIYASLLGLQDKDQIQLPNIELPVVPDSTLNESQNDALAAAMKHSLTLIWGPPGTGKTHTIIVILCQLLRQLPKSRFLITAPTHNAVDNILRRFVNDKDAMDLGIAPVRVSTQLSKVSQDLRQYTCDAMLGKDLTGNLPARRKAQKRIKEARLVFTTCIGASLGLLRDETFDVVVVDEASQQTEPATLVPLVKGCSRAILVGDHVQLRATVQKNAVLTGYDVSLFERHYNMPARKGVAKAMLDTQYRMHRSICDFSSTEFYQGKLKTQVPDDGRPTSTPRFPWPKDNRMVWVECSGLEDLGRQSKANQDQVQLCKRIVGLLTSSEPMTVPHASQSPKLTIVVLTPYTRQREALSSAIPPVEVSSIDGFQGREADIVVFVTVRCNSSNDIGFLADMRRLNVVMARAKCGVVVIGNKSTLVGGTGGGGDLDESKIVWKRLIERCAVAEIEDDTMPNPASA